MCRRSISQNPFALVPSFREAVQGTGRLAGTRFFLFFFFFFLSFLLFVVLSHHARTSFSQLDDFFYISLFYMVNCIVSDLETHLSFRVF
jgi:hypothetical protein